MSDTKTHWKKLHNPKYLGSYSLLPNQDLILTMDYAKKETVQGGDGRKDEAMVLYFLDNPKPMIVNATNAKTIQQVVKSAYIEEWKGKKIQLYVTKVSAFGSQVDALRVRPFEPKSNDQVEKAQINSDIIKALDNLPETEATKWKNRLKKARTEKTDTIQNLRTALKAIKDAI